MERIGIVILAALMSVGVGVSTGVILLPFILLSASLLDGMWQVALDTSLIAGIAATSISGLYLGNGALRTVFGRN
ncbi:MAG: hypothetical protein ACR2PG_04845 [Hyphomicrobiaceae bacterium]